MNSPFVDEVDHIQIDPGSDKEKVWDCDWNYNFKSAFPFRNEIPVWVRREFFNQNSAIPHRHVDINALIIVRRGRGTRIVNGYPHCLVRGDIFLMAQDNVHAFESASHLYLDIIYFHQSLWTDAEWNALRQVPALESYLTPGPEAFAARGHTDYFGHLSSEPHGTVERSYDHIRRLFNSKQLTKHFCVRNMVFNELVFLSQWREGGHFTTRPARGAGIAEVTDYCDNNFQKDVKIDQLAAMMHFSDAHFREVFTREVGVPPATYLRRLRLLHAKTLLHDLRLSVAEIARVSGFEGTTQFGRAFKKAFGVAPLQYRRNPKAAP